MTKVFPIGMIVLSLAAAIVYGCAKDFKHMGYWISSACLIYFVTF